MVTANDLILSGLKQLFGFEEDDLEDNSIKQFNPLSEAISSVSYDGDTSELKVQFHSSGVYTYHGVSRQRYQAFENALSKGGYLNSSIKPLYSYSRGF